MNKAAVSGAAAVVVVVGAYLGFSAYSGSVVHRQVDAALDQAAGALPALKITDRKYEQGLFSSTASATLQIGCLPPITVREQIAHGPFPAFAGAGLARIDTQIVLPQGAPEQLRAWAAALKPEAIRTAIGFGGASTTNVNLPAGQLKDGADSLQWQPLQAQFQMNGARTSMSYTLDAPEVALSFAVPHAGESAGDGATGSIKFLNLHGQATGAPAGGMSMGNGAGTFTLGQVQAVLPGGVQIDLNQLNYTVHSQVQNDLGEVMARITAAAHIQMGETAIKLDAIDLQESMKRIHAPTLQKLSLGFWQEMGSGLCQPQSADLAQTMQARQAAMLAALGQLLPYDPEYSVDKLAVSYAGQEGTLSYSVAAHGITAQELQQPDARALLGKITVKASGKVPVAWLEKIAARMAMGGPQGSEPPSPQQVQQAASAQVNSQIDSLVAAGYATREGDSIASSALFEHGQLTVNGKAVQVPLGQ